jgi:hypothetical protein
MRSSDVLTAFAERLTLQLALIFTAVACNGGEQLPGGTGGNGGASGEGVGGSGTSAGTNNGTTDAAGGAEGTADGANSTDTGNTGCGTIAAPNAWAGWMMPNPVHSGLPNPASYTVSASGSHVTDNVTGLIWQRNVEARSFTWDGAKQYCACMTIDGVGGWRLPSRVELVSLADWTAANPSIDPNAFPDTPSVSFWSSSVFRIDSGLGWLIYFGNGHTSYADMGYTYRARCVRYPSSAIAPSGRYTIANGTVYDTQTKLTWQQETSTSTYPWEEAKTYCSQLSLDGTGWRLPGLGELQTIVDESMNPSVDPTAFPMTPSEYFWSSAVMVEDTSRAWACFFSNGSTYSFTVTTPHSVRCVR